jgi:hypothetical protein
MKSNKKSQMELVGKKEKMASASAQLQKSQSVQVINRNVLVHSSIG